jgi:hypothetical protein
MLKWLIFWLLAVPTFAWAEAPTLAVSHTASERIAKGTPIQISIDYQNAPDDAGLVVWLVPDVPEAEYQTIGRYPALLVLGPIKLKGSGRHVMDWNGRDIGCAPMDAPMWCADDILGRYRFEAALYETSNFSLLGMMARQLPKALVRNRSSAFEATGTIDIGRYRSLFDAPASQYLADRLNLHSAGVPGLGNGNTELYLKARDGITLGAEGYCAIYDGKSPFAGQVKVCFSASLVGPYGVNWSQIHRDLRVAETSEMATEPGLLPYKDALARARPLADAPYVARLKMESLPLMFSPLFGVGADVGRRVGDNVNSWGRGGTAHNERVQGAGVTTWSFDVGASAWVFVIYQIKYGGRETDPDRFADNVMVRVEPTGKACVIETRPYKAPFSERAAVTPCP